MNYKNGKEIIYHGRLNDFFAYTIGLIDKDGKLISEYWNPGHYRRIELIDYNRDGTPELFAGGCNNQKQFASAVLTVFDVDFIKGFAPLTDPLKNGEKGLEMYYIVFPRTVILDNSKEKKRSDINDIKLTEKGITVWVEEESEGNNLPATLYVFNNNFELLDVSFSDTFEMRYEKLIKENKIPDISLEKYLKSLKSKVLWWNGDKFVNTPSMNKHYLAAKQLKIKNEK